VSGRESSGLLREQIGVQSEILSLFRGAFEPHDSVRLQDWAVEAANGNADVVAVFQGTGSDSFRTPFSQTASRVIAMIGFLWSSIAFENWNRNPAARNAESR
jgi:hypothetical protein